jgi:hypothetical protein
MLLLIIAGVTNLTLLSSLKAGPPSISAIANQMINEDTAAALAFTVGDAETPASSLIVSALCSNPALVPTSNIVFAGSGANRVVTVIPSANKFGTATITLTVTDGDGTTSSQSFLVTVVPVNDQPTLDPIPNRSVAENSGAQTVTLTGISSGSADENQTLTATALSSLPSVIPNPVVTYTSPNSTGSLTFTPVPGTNGTATITVSVNDGSSTNNIVSRSFLVTVNPLTSPTISPIADQTIAEDTLSGPLAFIVRDRETPASSLIVSTHSSNPTLVPPANILIGGSGTNRIVTVIPAPNTFGMANITLTVSDSSGATASSTFSLTVTAMLRIAQARPNVILTWTATNAVLQECDSISGGTWQDVTPPRTSPCTMPATGLKFLRLREAQ